MEVKEIAKRICSGSSCPNCFDCGIEKDYTVPPIGDNTVCPIAKYNLPKERFIPKDLIDRLANKVYLEDLDKVCKECEHSYKEQCYEAYCLDCPVYSCIETEILLGAEYRG